MLDNVNLDRKLSRDEYDQALPALQRRLYDLERECWQRGIGSIIVFEGWEASGKGGCISTLTQRLDPRGFKLHLINAPRTSEAAYPWLWRFWLKVPQRGEMAIFDRSWYRRVLEDRVDSVIPAAEWRKAYNDIVDFERMLADDGIVITKFFLHISKKEQKNRFRKMEQDPLESWRITVDEWHRHEQYDQFAEAVEEMLERTETDFAPWTIVEATSRKWARRKVFETIILALEHRVQPAADLGSDETAVHDAELRALMSSFEHKGGGS